MLRQERIIMGKQYYIASCNFTAHFPKTSLKVQEYVRERWGYPVVRCCVPRYKLKEFEGKMPEGKYRDAWCDLKDCADFQPGDLVFSPCHNCNNIIEESRPGVSSSSLLELIDADDSFPFPDYSGMKVTIQDCWRSKDRRSEQDAARSLLSKMHIDYIEAAENHEKTEFCGNSLLRPQPARNPKLAPKHYVDGAKGKFIPHTPEEQKAIMEEYCSQFQTKTVVCYCHYCYEGLVNGGVDARHIATLLFPDEG